MGYNITPYYYLKNNTDCCIPFRVQIFLCMVIQTCQCQSQVFRITCNISKISDQYLSEDRSMSPSRFLGNFPLWAGFLFSISHWFLYCMHTQGTIIITTCNWWVLRGEHGWGLEKLYFWFDHFSLLKQNFKFRPRAVGSTSDCSFPVSIPDKDPVAGRKVFDLDYFRAKIKGWKLKLRYWVQYQVTTPKVKLTIGTEDRKRF